jgi:hypothetical protein
MLCSISSTRKLSVRMRGRLEVFLEDGQVRFLWFDVV